MNLAIIDSFSLQEDEIAKIESLKKKFPEIQNLYDEISEVAQKVIDQLHQVYIDNNLNMNEYEREENSILKLTYLYFGFRTLSVAITKAGSNLVRLKDAYNKIITDKENIKNDCQEKMRSLENELEQFKRQVGENNHKKIDDMKLKTKLKVIEDKQKVLATPIEYGKCKEKSVSSFIDGLMICMSDVKIRDDGFIEITGEQINLKKKQMGLKKIDAPRGVNNKDIILSKPKH